MSKSNLKSTNRMAIAIPTNQFYSFRSSTHFLKMLTVAGETRVACVIFGVQSDSDVVDAVGVFC